MLIYLLLHLTAFASISSHDFCAHQDLKNQPILAEGRPITLEIYSEKLRKSLFSGDACKSIPATKLYCLLSLAGQKGLEGLNCSLQLKADHIETFKLLGLKSRSDAITPEMALLAKPTLLARYHQLQQEGSANSGLGSDLGNFLTRINKYEAIVSGADWKILSKDKKWISIKDSTDNEVLTSAQNLTEEEKSLVANETLYEKLHLFGIAIFIALIGFVCALGAKRSKQLKNLTLVSMGILIAIEITAMTLRSLISGRAPITNMFETVMWVGFSVLVLSLILGLKTKQTTIWAVGLAGNAITLFMMNFAKGMLDGNIQPLVPVLRDNFWLSTHVTSVSTSYACFTFSWLLSNFVLITKLAFPRKATTAFIDNWNTIVRIGIQIGSVFLAGGVILGGVWADYSWGRFWGWDPKETWSLIALVIYMGVLHGRYVGWFKGLKFTLAASLSYLSIIMAWFGVNYILAVGLHSYGFSSGGATFIGAILGIQLIIAGLSYYKIYSSR